MNPVAYEVADQGREKDDIAFLQNSFDGMLHDYYDDVGYKDYWDYSGINDF